MLPGLTYTALGGSTPLLDVQVTELTTGGLDDADLLAPGVVGRATPLPIVSLQSQQLQDPPSPPSARGLAVRRT
jgi:hypothetical protein